MIKDELKIGLEELADRFSEGWHEGIKIDASDVMLLSKVAEALAQPEQEPDGYVQKVIDALYENSDPVSVEAAELLEHMAQPEQEPVACIEYIPCCTDKTCPKCKATALPQRTWVGLTDEDWDEIFGNALTIGEAIKATEAKLKEKNT